MVSLVVSEVINLVEGALVPQDMGLSIPCSLSTCSSQCHDEECPSMGTCPETFILDPPCCSLNSKLLLMQRRKYLMHMSVH